MVPQLFPRDQRLAAVRLKISRSRRRVDRHMRAAGAEAHRLQSWKTYVTSFPGSTILAVLGLGLAIVGGWKARSILRWFGGRLMQQAWISAQSNLIQELHGIWTRSMQKSQASTSDGASHE